MTRKNCVLLIITSFLLSLALPAPQARAEALQSPDPLLTAAIPTPMFSGGAQPLLTSAQSLFGGKRAGLTSGITAQIAPSGPSLFSGRAAGSLFEPVAPRPVKIRHTVEPETSTFAPSIFTAGARDVQRIRYLIGRAESRADGYDAVQYGAKIKPAKKPTQMTLGEVFAWIDATPNQQHAIGRYQFIPKTLGRLVTLLDLGPEVVFSPEVQDSLSDILLVEAGLYEVRSGEIKRQTFMYNLAKIWAGLPTVSGKSYYDGHAGNKSSMSWTEFDREMAKVYSS